MLHHTNPHNQVNVSHLPEPLAGCGADCGDPEAALPIVGTDGIPNCIFSPVSMVRFCLTLLLLLPTCANARGLDPWVSRIRKKAYIFTSINCFMSIFTYVVHVYYIHQTQTQNFHKHKMEIR